jgi:short-subunit dehydrogenase
MSADRSVSVVADAGAGFIITGASGGIGQALALALAPSARALLLVGRREDALKALQVTLQREHPALTVDYLPTDLSLPEGMAALASRAAQSAVYNVLINNAGTSDFHAFETQSPAVIENLLYTNLLSPIFLCQKMLPVLSRQSGAQIINIGSVFGDIGYPGFAVYCASKFGLRGFTQALRRELGAEGIRVRYFAPRATKTPLNSPAVVAMNEALNTQSDTVESVAQQFLDFFESGRNEQVLGWPERLFVFINRLRYSITDQAIGKQMNIIKRFLPR